MFRFDEGLTVWTSVSPVGCTRIFLPERLGHAERGGPAWQDRKPAHATKRRIQSDRS